MKFVGPLSDVAIVGPMTVEVNQNAGNRSANAIPDPGGTKRIHPEITRVRMKLPIRQRSTSRMERLSPNQGTSSYFRARSEEHTSELQSHSDLVCRLLLEKKKKKNRENHTT